jgi:hypothetical protein
MEMGRWTIFLYGIGILSAFAMIIWIILLFERRRE